MAGDTEYEALEASTALGVSIPGRLVAELQGLCARAGCEWNAPSN
jgi:hypothetical protein